MAQMGRGGSGDIKRGSLVMFLKELIRFANRLHGRDEKMRVYDNSEVLN